MTSYEESYGCLTLTLLLLVSALSCSAGAAESLPFTDVPETFPYRSSIQYVYDNGLMNGVGDDRFEPDASFTRAMFVTILGRMEGIDPANYTGTAFSDVSATKQSIAWAAPYIQWAAEKGIVNGVGDGKFAPNAAITREQYCAIILRCFTSAGRTLTPSASPSFPDSGTVSAYAVEAVRALLGCSLIELHPDGTFQPQRPMNRGEVARTFARIHAYRDTGTVPQILLKESGIPELAQENWTKLDSVPAELNAPDIAVPETFAGMGYDNALRTAEKAGVELTWAGKMVLSPSGKRAVYSTNKTDLLKGTYSLVLLDVGEQTEQVAADTGAQLVYPLWWWDEERLVYQKDTAYCLLDVSGGRQAESLPLLENGSYIFAYDREVFVTAPAADNTTARVIYRLTESGIPERIATCAPEEGKNFMAECGISQTLRLAAFKERNERNVRSIYLFSYETGCGTELPLPKQLQSGEAALTDLCFCGKTLYALFSDSTGELQIWAYDF